MIRKLVWKFRKSMAERAVPKRFEHEMPINISFAPPNCNGKIIAPPPLTVRGTTRDLSKCGVAFVVPSIRLREYYLVGEDRLLNAELNLPDGKVQMKIIGRRYEQLGDLHSSTNCYLIGASIEEMSGDDRKIFESFLRAESKMQISQTAKLELEIGKS